MEKNEVNLMWELEWKRGAIFQGTYFRNSVWSFAGSRSRWKTNCTKRSDSKISGETIWWASKPKFDEIFIRAQEISFTNFIIFYPYSEGIRFKISQSQTRFVTNQSFVFEFWILLIFQDWTAKMPMKNLSLNRWSLNTTTSSTKQCHICS